MENDQRSLYDYSISTACSCMTSQLRVPFAIDGTGRVVEARTLARDDAGPFVCAACKSPLVARRGDVNVWHFAHKTEGNCETAFETAVHAMAKQILFDARYFRTPGLICRAYVLPSEKDICLCEERTVHWEFPGEVELSLEEIRPDFIVSFGDERLIIEVAVTHFSNKGKKAKLNALQIPAVEVDLSDVPRTITAANLKSRLLDSVDDKSWLYYPGLGEAEEKLRAVRERESEPNEVARRRTARQDKELDDRNRPSVGSRWFNDWDEDRRLSPAQRRQVEAANRNFLHSPESRKLAFVTAKLGIDALKWPSLLDVAVMWDDALGVSRRIWQADVFRRFIKGVLAGPHDVHQELNVGVVTKWLSTRYEFPAASDIRVRVAVLAFLSWLVERGYLHRLSESEFVAVRDALPKECLASPLVDEP